jgi:hypothetical protein
MEQISYSILNPSLRTVHIIYCNNDLKRAKSDRTGIGRNASGRKSAAVESANVKAEQLVVEHAMGCVSDLARNGAVCAGESCLTACLT